MAKRLGSVIREYMANLGRKGGKSRAAKYDRRMLSRWGKLGGRPPNAKKRGKE